MYKGNISLGAIFLIPNLVNGAILLIAMESIITYGVYSGLGLALGGGIAFYLATPVILKIRKEFLGEKDFFLYLKTKLSLKGFFLVSLFSILNSAGIMLLQLMAASLCFKAVFNSQFPIGQTLIFGLGLFLRRIRKDRQLNRLAIIQMVFVFAVALFLPLYLFIREGVDTIYTGSRLYHPYLFFLKDPEVYYFTLAYSFIALSSILLNNNFWRQVLALEAKKTLPALAFAGLIGSTLPLAYSTLVFDVLYASGFQNLATILSDLLKQISSPIFIFLFVFAIVVAVLYAYISQLESLSAFWTVWTEQKEGRKRNKMNSWMKYDGMPNVVATVLFLLSLGLKYSILQTVLITGIISVSTLIPLLVIIFYPGKIKAICPLFMLVGAITGIVASLLWSIFAGIAASLSVTTLLCLILMKFPRLIRETF